MTMQAVITPTFSEKRETTLRIEDMIGKFILILFFVWQLFEVSMGTAGSAMQARMDVMWWLSFVSHITSVGFVAMIVGLTITRKAPIDVARGLEARVSAFMGTFILLSLMGVPGVPVSKLQMLIGTCCIILGSAASIWCIKWLGRSFSVMAAARNLVTSGPYAHVRHPLYTAEALTVIGVVLCNGSTTAYAIGALQFFFQYRRMVNEEKILATVHPSYVNYKARTPMVIPRLFSGTMVA